MKVPGVAARAYDRSARAVPASADAAYADAAYGARARSASTPAAPAPAGAVTPRRPARLGGSERPFAASARSPADLLADATALSIEGLGAAADFWRAALAICSSSLRAPAPRPGQLFFQIDQNAETTAPLPLGNVRAADLDRLEATPLARDGGAEIIPSANVLLTLANDEVLVALASLKSVRSALVPGLYRGAIQRRSPGSPAAAEVTQLLVSLR